MPRGQSRPSTTMSFLIVIFVVIGLLIWVDSLGREQVQEKGGPVVIVDPLSSGSEGEFSAACAKLFLSAGYEVEVIGGEAVSVDRLKVVPSGCPVLVNTSFNVSPKGFPGAVSMVFDDATGWRLVDILGARPKQVYEAILKAHPKLSPYVCTGKQWKWLQTTDSEIMIEVLGTLAGTGVVGLPLHDSVIAPTKYIDIVRQVMSYCYEKKMGFEPCIK